MHENLGAVLGDYMTEYFDELNRAMTFLGQHPKTKFIGQGVLYDDHALFRSMVDVPMDKRLELPVFENTQFGISIGLALEGWIPVNIYPRFDFLLSAADQIVNHLSVMRQVSYGGFKPRVITRVSVGATWPLNYGLQHCQDHTEAFRLMCKDEIEIVSLIEKEQVYPAYHYALVREDSKPTILVEYGSLYYD